MMITKDDEGRKDPAPETSPRGSDPQAPEGTPRLLSQVEKDLAQLSSAVVALDQIDSANTEFQYRSERSHPCEPTDLEVDDAGVVDCSELPHPVILCAGSGSPRYRIIGGHGRIAVMRANPRVTAVRCRVWRDAAHAVLTIAAARANLAHGQVLSKSEKRRCFEAEKAAIQEGGFADLSICQWARAYGVARNTIKAWLAPPAGQPNDECVAQCATPESREATQPQAVPPELGAGPAYSPPEVDGDIPAADCERPDEHTDEGNIESALADLEAAAQLLFQYASVQSMTTGQRQTLNVILLQLGILAQLPGVPEAAA